MEKQATQVLRG
ncbi:unnamed protein product, partial [Didymodactylos carnosus]